MEHLSKCTVLLNRVHDDRIQYRTRAQQVLQKVRTIPRATWPRTALVKDVNKLAKCADGMQNFWHVFHVVNITANAVGPLNDEPGIGGGDLRQWVR